MQKKILIFSLAAFLTGAPVVAAPMIMELGVAEMIDEPAVTLQYKGNILYVNGAQGETLEIISLTGRAVASIKIDSPAQKVELNLAKGCYIMKVGKVSRKVTIH